MQFFPRFIYLENLPKKFSVIINSGYIWDPLIRNLPKIRLKGFLYKDTILKKNQPGVSMKVVFIFEFLLYFYKSCT